jgi:hypothetical protein
MKLYRPKALILVALAVFTLHMPCARAADEGAGTTPAPNPQAGDKAFLRECTVARGIRRRLENDLAAVRAALKGVPAQQDLEASCAAIEDDIAKLPITSPITKSAPSTAHDLTTEFPINKLQERIFAVQAALWRAKGLKAITLWQKNPWDRVSPTELPRSDGAKIVVQMMCNEFRSAAFNISNAGETVASVSLSIEGLPGGVNPESITVHAGTFTDTKSGVPVMAALPLANRECAEYGARRVVGGYLFEIHPGLTRQVWLTFNSRDVAPGEYGGTILIQPGALQVSVAWKVYPLTFPDRPTLHLGGWDYTSEYSDRGVTPENKAALIRHLREHFVDTPWAMGDVLPTGEYDQDGRMVKEPDAGNFERWVRLWPDARNYYVALGGLDGSFCGLKMGTPPFQKAVASWITWWANKLKAWNIRPDQLGLLLGDEPDALPQSEEIIAYARVIRAAQPQVVVWEDVTWLKPWEAPPELFTLCTVLCPNLNIWIEQGKRYADFYLRQCDEGRQLWFYSCSGPGQLLDPYSYCRMQSWFCWKYGARGSCFWAFGDTDGASSWNEYLAAGPGAYTPFFLDDKTVTPGKHMEAIREGVEDYEYLHMLRDRVAELENAGKKGEALDSAKRLLASAADRVTASVTKDSARKWAAPKDRSVADAVRVEVLEALMNLRNL